MKKNTILFFMLALGFFMTSCCNNDDATGSVEPVLAGKWEFAKQGNISSQGVEFFVDYPNTEGCSKDFVLLNANNTFVHSEFFKNEDICAEDAKADIFTKTNNIIVLDFSGTENDSEWEVLNITQSELKVKEVVSEEGKIAIVYQLVRA